LAPPPFARERQGAFTLPVPARMLSPLVPLHQKHRRNH